jgi:hypothetical protein
MRPRASARGDGQRRFTACAIHRAEARSRQQQHRRGQFTPFPAAASARQCCPKAAVALSRSDEGRRPHRARPSCGNTIKDRFKLTGAFRLPIEGWLESRTVVRSSALRGRYASFYLMSDSVMGLEVVSQPVLKRVDRTEFLVG